jgi:omega-hydroxy-beta-dihydromenaquinone-9 sulfotransferase
MEFDHFEENPLMVTNTPIAGLTLPNFLHLLAQNKFHISPRYVPRFVYSLTLCAFMAPFSLKERILYDNRIQKTKITKPPVFIIGHWRSGTTYLHNLLSQDKNLGYFSTFQAYLPAIFLSNESLFKPLVSTSLPKRRPMDDVLMNADYPQEDQYAIGAFSPYSYYNGWFFPRNMEYYNKFICMENASQFTIDEWKKIYLYLLKKMTLQQQGKQLILKNQDNTGKIKLLLEMFPDAKFIFLYRNPYTLYYSMTKFMSIVLPRFCIQTPPPFDVVEQSMMNLYTKMTKKYLNERTAIPNENLVELRYEDYISHPLKQLQIIYKHLQLEGYERIKPVFKTYLSTQATIKLDHYPIDEAVKQKVEKTWGFAIKEFGY